MSTSEQHLFALYCPFNSLQKLSDAYVITDKTLMHRILKVLRLKEGERFILFDDAEQKVVALKNSSSSQMYLHIIRAKPHKPLQPPIHWLLPLLKKEAFEASLYTLSQMGITSIQPIITQKSARSWGSEKDIERAHALMKAAAEQAKQFILPIVHPVCNLTSWQVPHNTQLLFFDVEGKPLKQLLSELTIQPVVCLVGPEGDMTFDEKEYLRLRGFTFGALTESVLRAQEAITVSAGLLRSFLRS